MDSIPKIIHFIWLGNQSLPYRYMQNIGIAAEFNKDYQIAIWTDKSDIKLFNRSLYDKEKHNPAAQADLLRLEVLYQFGGIYSDCDIEYFKPMEFLKLNPHKLTVVEEKGIILNNAFLAAPPKHPVVKELIYRCAGRAHHQVLPARYGPGLIMDAYRDFSTDIDVISNRIVTSPITAGVGGLLIPDKFAYHSYNNSWYK